MNAQISLNSIKDWQTIESKFKMIIIIRNSATIDFSKIKDRDNLMKGCEAFANI